MRDVVCAVSSAWAELGRGLACLGLGLGWAGPVGLAGRVEPGQILVTRATDPGWTPLFSIVGGLVLEVGGQLSHGAIVAREYGLPAVVNVPGATTRIQDGQTIGVDGSAGLVYWQDGVSGSGEAEEQNGRWQDNK